MLVATTRIFVGRAVPGKRMSVPLEDTGNVVHISMRLDGLSGCLVTDLEYPQRVAFSLIRMLLDKFTGTFSATQIAGFSEGDSNLTQGKSFGDIDAAILDWQDPKKVE